MSELKVIYQCPTCKKDACVDRDINSIEPLHCEGCSKSWDLTPFQKDFDHCPICDCKAFYIQKSIHPWLMWGGLSLAIVLVPKTYGLSLPVLWLLDLAIHKKIPNLLVCYRCRASFQGLIVPERFKQFQHWVGDKYEQG